MTSGGNNFNDFPENQLTKFQLGGKNVTILRTFAALFQYNLSTAEKTGHFALWEGLGRDVGQLGQNTGRPGKYKTVGNPTLDPRYRLALHFYRAAPRPQTQTL